jgi:hypothetical protein
MFSKKSTNRLGSIIWVPKLVFKILNFFDEGIIYLCTNVYIFDIVS